MDLPQLLGPEWQEDPEAWFEKVRAEQGPVARMTIPGGAPAWVITGYEEILQVLRRPSVFANDTRGWSGFRDGLVGPENPIAAALTYQPLCAFMDGSDHERLRIAITESLGQISRHGIRRYVRRFANQLIDEFCERGTAELVEDYAWRLPAMVMTQLLGMAQEYEPQLVHAVRDQLSPSPTAGQSREYVLGRCAELVARKRAEAQTRGGLTGKDLASMLISHPSGLSDEEVASHLWYVLVSANETTSNLIANTLRVTFTRGDTLRDLAGATLTMDEAVYRALWEKPPVALLPYRVVKSDTQLGEQHLAEGDLVMLSLLAGNKDPRLRTDGREVHALRNSSYLSFGHGPHQCPGEDVGRSIAGEAVGILLERLPGIHVPERAALSLEEEPGMVSNRLKALPVRFPKQPRQAEPAPVVEAPARTPVEQPVAAPVEPSSPAAASLLRRLMAWLRGGSE